MKAVYFSNYDLQDTSSGVSKKISMQIDAFKRLGVDITCPKVNANSLLAKIYMKMPFISTLHDWRVNRYIKYEMDKDVEFVYIRYNLFSRMLVYNLKLLKKEGIV